MKTWALLSFTACGISLPLCGCGGGSAPAVPVAPAVSPLAGNWLIVGPMPANGLVSSTGFRLALTFDVNGSNVTAAGFGNDSCGNAESSFGFGSLATGTIAADGSFTLQTPANFPEGTISIQGTVPKASDSSWQGSYTVSFNAPLVPSTCDTTLTGTFTATPFPLVSGVYGGTGSSQTVVNGVLTTTPLTFQVTLQQGGTVATPIPGGTFTSKSVLVGSIRVQGSACFTSGVTGSRPVSAVEGNQVVAQFTMDDGSTLSILGTLTDATETRITTNVALVNGGQCGTVPYIFQLPELDRQS
jgi:hypothetical protein